MLRLRPYKSMDAEHIISWFQNPRQFTMWSAGKFTYPLTRDQMAEHQKKWDGNEMGWMFTALDEQGSPVGHFMMRKADYEKGSIHMGFIVVNPQIRGKGYGKEMVRLAARYAYDILGVKRITLNVFEENEAARRCYLAVGFQEEQYIEGAFRYKEEVWNLYRMAKRME